jgi:cell wall-associated NlpC family hydrolase
LLGAAIFAGCAGPPRYITKSRPIADQAAEPVSEVAAANARAPGVERDRFKAIYNDLLGTKYAYGGQSSRGYDCSGLMQKVFWSYDQIRLPRTVHDMFQSGRPVPGSALQTGDLVFFNTSGRGASHVGVYLWDDMFLHASRSEGVTLTDITEDYWSARFLGARRVLD